MEEDEEGAMWSGGGGWGKCHTRENGMTVGVPISGEAERGTDGLELNAVRTMTGRQRCGAVGTGASGAATATTESPSPAPIEEIRFHVSYYQSVYYVKE
jgi:hypothetical protein